MSPQGLEQAFIDGLGSGRHGGGVSKGQFFEIGKFGGLFEFIQCAKFLVGQAKLSADGRPDVHSERAAYTAGDLHVDQRLERRRQRTGGLLRQFHVQVTAKQTIVMGYDP